MVKRLDLPKCAGGCPASRTAMTAVDYCKRHGISTYIATAEDSRYAKSKKQQAFLKKMGFGGDSIDKLYSATSDYEDDDDDGTEMGKRTMLEMIIERSGEDPRDIVFFDDLPENVAKARKMGIRSYLMRRRRITGRRYTMGITPGVLKLAINRKPRVMIFDIDGTLTDEATCEELYPGLLD